MEPDYRLLKAALLANGVFSIITGLVAVLFADAIGDFMEVEPLVLRFIGVGVVVFGATVYWFSRHDPFERGFGVFTTIADLTWVAGSAILLIGYPDLVTSGGNVLIGVIALFVLVFAVLQVIGLRRAR